MLNRFPRYFAAMVLICLHLPVLSFGSLSVAPPPDWAIEMMGEWEGSGERVHLVTQGRTHVEVRVASQWRGDLTPPALISRNEFVETTLDRDGAPAGVRRYLRVYWVREVERSTEMVRLQLGGGENPTGPAASEGFYGPSNRRMSVRQNLGAGTWVDSVSDFVSEGVSRYREFFFFGGQPKTESRIEFLRIY